MLFYISMYRLVTFLCFSFMVKVETGTRETRVEEKWQKFLMELLQQFPYTVL